MNRSQLRDLASILDAKYSSGRFGLAPIVSGRADDVPFITKLLYDRVEKKVGLTRRKTKTSFHRFIRFETRLRWHTAPLTVINHDGSVEVEPGVPGDFERLSVQQIAVLQQAFAGWPRLQVTHLGMEMDDYEANATAQQWAVTVQSLCDITAKLRDLGA